MEGEVLKSGAGAGAGAPDGQCTEGRHGSSPLIVERSSAELGKFLVRTSRYCMLNSNAFNLQHNKKVYPVCAKWRDIKHQLPDYQRWR